MARIQSQLFSVSSFTLLALALLCPTSTQAGVVLAIQQQGLADINNLTIGQTVSIEVVLKDLGPGESLVYLAATVDFNPSHWGSPISVDPGAIVPDLAGLVLSSSIRNADGNYDVLFAPGSPIVSNGVFFSFSVQAQAVGSGVFDFSFLTAEDSIGPVSIVSDLPLSYTIVAGTVPEPASWMIFLVSMSSYSLRRKPRV